MIDPQPGDLLRLPDGQPVIFESWERGPGPKVARCEHRDGTVELYLPEQLELAALQPVRWVMPHESVFGHGTIHRAGCELAVDGDRVLDAGEELRLHRAPARCSRCRPMCEIKLS